MPSLACIQERVTQFNNLKNLNENRNIIYDGIDPKKTFYIINPSLDLINSQKFLEPYFIK